VFAARQSRPVGVFQVVLNTKATTKGLTGHLVIPMLTRIGGLRLSSRGMSISSVAE
jgi:hypothetical protein